MNTTRWVQHISGIGSKWRVAFEPLNEWHVFSEGSVLPTSGHFLPKSEYRLCDPPEIWKDVSGECEVRPGGEIMHNGNYTTQAFGYRRRKVELSSPFKQRFPFAFIIEQRVQP